MSVCLRQAHDPKTAEKQTRADRKNDGEFFHTAQLLQQNGEIATLGATGSSHLKRLVESPLDQLLEWACEQRDRVNPGVMGLGYADDDLESKEFFDNLPLTKATDEKYVKLHLGRHSHRRICKDPYSIDGSGKLCYKGRPLNMP